MALTLTLRNGSIVGLARWVGNQPLSGQSSRLRTRFISVLSPTIKGMEEYRLSLMHEYANTDEKGEYIMVEDNYGRTSFDIDPDDLVIVNKKYEDKLEESTDLQFGEDHEKSYAFIKNLVLNTSYEFKTGEAEDYDKWCTAFEAV